ncbi:ABC transporter ATP-binding protein [Corynebacterium epidermidicanis]|uniref:ABC-type multidrug transport system, ATPase and permease component n=1 Tax=Corynebacterium epidermidicanis TaxID=1050174 RepID=A0A0G3GUG6_9CORY|nr:ABC transporter ATP-binding protein [Corynebacterium epidermidicanis]AKK03163.1 ABC-type multidrug transport system, ATPase and permease component [Corynebacterium epidermidicanis]
MRSDALAPAPIKETLAYVASLPARPSKRWWWTVSLIFLITMTSLVTGSSAIGWLVDAARGESNTPVPLLIGVLIVVLFVEVVGRSSAQFYLISAVRKLSVSLRSQALRSALRAPTPDSLALGTGNIITRLTKDIDTTVRVANAIGVRLVITGLMFPFTFIALTLVHPIFGITLVALLVVIFPFARANLRLFPATANAVSVAEAKRNNLLLDSIRGAQTLTTFGFQQWGLNRMRAASWDTVDAAADRMPLINRLTWQGSLIYGALVILGFVEAAVLSQRGDITVGAAAASVVLISRMEVHIFNLMFFAGEIQHALTALGRAVALAQFHATTSSSTDPTDIAGAPDVEIRNLSFSYGDGPAVLHDINLELPAGSTTALVGASGAGKSTLAAILAGGLRPTDGQVSVDGINTADVSAEWLSRNVVLATQEVHLFSGTVRDDLLLAAPHASDIELDTALAAVGLKPNSITYQRWLPEGLDTLIGSGATELSPEVAQQISLARLFLSDPPVLILDEATADAGSDNARDLEAAAGKVTQGRTALVVAHRLDQAKDADNIVFMEQGRIVESGTHEQLMKFDGKYAHLFRTWQR